MRTLFSDAPLATQATIAPLILRLAVGIIFVVHGSQKLMTGISGVSGFLESLGFPLPILFAIVLIAAEFIGGFMLIAGIWTRLVARILALISIIAWLTVHVSKGFFITAGGYEFIMLLFAACISLAITGPGRWSLAALLGKNTRAVS